MNDFLMKCEKRFHRFGLSDDEIHDAIKSACDFFFIPMPRLIEDLTNVQGGQTMFLNWDPNSYVAPEMLRRRIPLTIQNLVNEFMVFRQQHMDDLRQLQSKYYNI